ncbi:MAG: MotA/TolQ/ExbB proton channel family protein [Desulfovibrio sp.]
MRHTLTTLPCVFLAAVLFVTPVFADDSKQSSSQAPANTEWQTAVGEITKLHDVTINDAKQTVESINKERAALSQELKVLKAENTRREENYKALTAKFNGLVEAKNTLDEELKSQQSSMQFIEGTVRTNAKQFRKRALNSPATAERPDRQNTIKTILDMDHFPGIESIQNLVDMWFYEIDAAGNVQTRINAECVAPDGTSKQGTVTRIGTLGAIFQDETGKASFLRPDFGGKLEIISGDFNGARSNAKQFLTEITSSPFSVAPLDFSGGEVFKRFDEKSGFMTTLVNGGVLVWPILIVGFFGFILTAERVFTLSRIHTCPDCQMGKAMEWASKGNLKQCASCLGKKGNTPTCRVLKHVVLHSGGTLVSMEKGLQEAILQELPKLERFLPTINIFAAVAPLLGLLGTVTGMISTFQVITVFGTGDARMMSGGISEALITTQLGLAVAVPLTLMHHFLERKVDRMVADMEEKGTTLVSRIVASDQAKPEYKKGTTECSTNCIHS